MSSGIETNDLDDSLPAPSPSTSATTEPSDAASDTEQESGAHTVKQRRDLLQSSGSCRPFALPPPAFRHSLSHPFSPPLSPALSLGGENVKARSTRLSSSKPTE
uniref:Uncharacterized protein n=1 Tax=Knipowitschia caucasica TaxID=637954 RepID=A0AAV2KJL3_KNICA